MSKFVKKHWFKPILCLTLIFSIVLSATAATAFAEFSVDKESLVRMTDYATSLKEEDNMGTEEDWTNLQTAIEETKAIIDKQDATKEEIANAYYNIVTCLEQVLDMDMWITISDLEWLVAKAEASPKPPVATDAWNNLQDALAVAKKVLADPTTATKEDLATAYYDLYEAKYLFDMEILPSQLQALIDEASTLKESDYTADSWAAYQSAIKGAKEVLNDPYMDVIKLSEALDNLETAKAGLVKVTPTPSSSSPASSKPAASSKTTPPKTGDSAALSIATLGVLAAALIILKKKRIF